jgi:hypothetical protein
MYNNLKQTMPDATGSHIFIDHFYTSPTFITELPSQECHQTRTSLLYRKYVSASIKKPKLKKGEKVAYHSSNTLFLAWRGFNYNNVKYMKCF